MTDSGNSYEKKDVNVSRIIGYALALTIILVAILVFLNEYFIIESEKMKAETANHISSKLRELRAQEDAILTSYKLLDAERQKYQIPIERAIQLLANEAFESQKVQ